jgi:hypothetical protein
MRERLLDSLSPVSHERFLVYLMGPYKAFTLTEALPDDVETSDLAGPFDDWRPEEGEYAEEDVLGLLERVRDRLREDAGLNAFLAIDIGIELDEMNAASQSIEFARASNVTAFLAPNVGKNLGLGVETGSVLEALAPEGHERVVFLHEKGVRSAMIASLSRRWEATVYPYADEDELVKHLREFSVDVMNREFTGDLARRR